MTELPTPECRYGYPADQVARILADHFDARTSRETQRHMARLDEWMRNKTHTVCDGDEGCAHQGTVGVTPAVDVARFLASVTSA